MLANRFQKMTPTSTAWAAEIALDAVKADRWRILVSEDVTGVDQRVRAKPECAYDLDFSPTHRSDGRDQDWGYRRAAPQDCPGGAANVDYDFILNNPNLAKCL